jgi:hypothetical protein
MADVKISELSAVDTVVPNDILVMVSDPSGTPVTKSSTLSKVAGLFSYPSGISGASAITNIVSISDTDYTALSPKVSGVLYVVVPD